MEFSDLTRFRRGATIEELMPDEDRRAYALEQLDAVVKHAHELFPNQVPPPDCMSDEERRDYALEIFNAVVRRAHELLDRGQLEPPDPLKMKRPGWVKVLQALADGSDIHGAASRLHLTPETIKTHTKNARSALDANDTLHAVAVALRKGLIQ